MRVYKDTPFELSFMPWEVEPPRPILMVVVKGTFTLRDAGPCAVAEQQVPCLGEVPWDDGDPPSLRTESDYAVLKPRGEWYLSGHAYAAGGAAVTVLPVRVRVGSLQKQISVWGDRVWRRGVLGSKPSDPVAFTQMALRWERSFGGPGIADNPVGRGLAPIQTDKGAIDPLPNIEDAAHPIVSREDRPRPAGMFPIPNTWRARTRKTGTYDEIWKISRWPYFPRDFDYGFFNCAPLDQQLPEGFWRGDEAMELAGLHAEHARLRTALPGLRARFFVEWASPRPADATPLELLTRPELEALGPPRLQEVPVKLDTVAIDTDAQHVMCTWRGLVEVADKQLSNVARVFAIHEPLDATHPHEHYEAWLQRKLLEDADEFSISPPDEDETDDELALPPAGAGPAESGDEVADAVIRFGVELTRFMDAVGEEMPEEPLPPAAEVREKYRELELDADALLPDPEPPPPDEIEESPSLLRLAAIVRRRLQKPFRELDLSNAPYRKLDLSGVDFSGAILTEGSLAGANLRGAIFDGAVLARADLSGADARAASFREADLSEVRASDARFEEAVLDGARGNDATFTRSRFTRASLLSAELEAGRFEGCDFREAKLDGADFVDSVMDGADLTGCSMLDTTLEGVHAHDANFERCKMADLRASDGADFTRARFVLVDAPRAQLQGTVLVDVNISGSNLEEADLSEARAERMNATRSVLRAAKLDRADLRSALFLQADLCEASFEEADLSGADARGAHLFSAHLWRARTDGTLLDGAIIDRTVLADPAAKRT